MKKTGAQIITTLLERQGVTTVAGIPGGCNLPLYDALHSSPIRHVLARHEQGAGFIAQGMARASGRAEVCLGTSGPGATNLLTAIADAKLDSVPMVAITGQVPQTLIGTDAFQEVDTYGLTLPITKHNFIVRHASELLEIIPQAFSIAESGRPGPVVVDVPKDVQLQTIEFDSWPEPGQLVAAAPGDSQSIARLADMIHGASRPILYIGGGIISAGASETLQALARKNHIPVTSTLMGLGAFPADDPLYLGMLGMHAERYTNHLLDDADLLLAVGVRFDDRATGRLKDFCRHADVVHIDIDPSEIDKLKATNLSIVGHAGEILNQLSPLIEPNTRPDWMAHIAALKAKYPLEKSSGEGDLEPMAVLRRLATMVGPDTIITTDVGQHQMWVAQAYPFLKPRTLQSSSGLGTMGFGLPAAIGAALAKPGQRVICISGDGSILMNIQELATLAELGLDVTIIIMNNGQLGLVRQQQELFYEKRFHASHFNAMPDFALIAQGFGVPSYDLSDDATPLQTIENALSAKGPNVINMPICQKQNVFPMVPPGGANHEMIGAEEQMAGSGV